MHLSHAQPRDLTRCTLSHALSRGVDSHDHLTQSHAIHALLYLHSALSRTLRGTCNLRSRLVSHPPQWTGPAQGPGAGFALPVTSTDSYSSLSFSWRYTGAAPMRRMLRMRRSMHQLHRTPAEASPPNHSTLPFSINTQRFVNIIAPILGYFVQLLQPLRCMRVPCARSGNSSTHPTNLIKPPPTLLCTNQNADLPGHQRSSTAAAVMHSCTASAGTQERLTSCIEHQ